MPTPDVVTGPPLVRLDAPALRMDDLTVAGAVIGAPIRLSDLCCVASTAALRHRAVRPCDQLEQVAVGCVEIDAAPAVIVVDLARAAAVVIGVVGGASGANAGERAVKFRFADQKRIVLVVPLG